VTLVHGAFNMIPKANDKVGNAAMGTADIPTNQHSYHVESQMKTMLITVFDIKGIVHFEYISQDQTVK
jgi:NCAIR mutase (PurE)-related protein